MSDARERAERELNPAIVCDLGVDGGRCEDCLGRELLARDLLVALDRADELERALRFWVDRADRFEEELPPARRWMGSRGVLSSSYEVGRASLPSAAATEQEPT